MRPVDREAAVRAITARGVDEATARDCVLDLILRGWTPQDRNLPATRPGMVRAETARQRCSARSVACGTHGGEHPPALAAVEPTDNHGGGMTITEPTTTTTAVPDFTTFGLGGVVDQATHWAYGFEAPAERLAALDELAAAVAALRLEASDELEVADGFRDTVREVPWKQPTIGAPLPPALPPALVARFEELRARCAGST